MGFRQTLTSKKGDLICIKRNKTIKPNNNGSSVGVVMINSELEKNDYIKKSGQIVHFFKYLNKAVSKIDKLILNQN